MAAQPRRLAAHTLYRRAIERGLGPEVGLRMGHGVRDESPRTRLWLAPLVPNPIQNPYPTSNSVLALALAVTFALALSFTLALALSLAPSLALALSLALSLALALALPSGTPPLWKP